MEILKWTSRGSQRRRTDSGNGFFLGRNIDEVLLAKRTCGFCVPFDVRSALKATQRIIAPTDVGYYSAKIIFSRLNINDELTIRAVIRSIGEMKGS